MVSYQLAPRYEDVLRELSAGNPVIVLQDLGFGGGWHYAVAVGYDYSYGDLILRSGITERETLPFGIHEFPLEAQRLLGDGGGAAGSQSRPPPTSRAGSPRSQR